MPASDGVTYSKIIELMDNSQYIAAMKKAEAEEKLLAGLRMQGGQAAVKAFRDTEAAAKQAAKETERAARGPSAWTLALQENTKAMGDLRGQINLGAESMGKLGAALGLVSPELAGVAGGLQKVTGLASAAATSAQLLGTGLATAAAVAGTVAVALSPLILLWRDHSEAVDASARAAKIWNEVQDDGLSLIERSKASVAALALETSGLTEAQKDEQRLALDWQKQTAIANAGIDEQIRLIEAQVGQNAELEAINKRRVAQGEEELEVIRKTSPAYAAQTELLKNLRGEKERNAKAAAEGFAADRKLVAIHKENDDVDRQLEQAEKDLAEAKRLGEEASRKKTAALKDETKASDDLKTAEQKELDAINALIDGNYGLSLSATSLALAQQEANAAIDDTIAGVNDYGEATEKTTEKTLEMTDKQKQALAGVAEAYDIASDAIGAHLDEVLDSRYAKITDLEAAIETAEKKGQTARAKGLKQQLAAEKAAAQKAFDQQQTLSAANATVNWLEALVKATTYGPIGGPIVAAAATAAYGFSLKSIESEKPEFTDTPRPVRLGGDRGRDVGGARGAENDSAVFYRDPNQGIAQIVGEAVRRSMPAPPRMSQVAFGLSLGSIGVNRLLTSDLRRANRNQLS